MPLSCTFEMSSNASESVQQWLMSPKKEQSTWPKYIADVRPFVIVALVPDVVEKCIYLSVHGKNIRDAKTISAHGDEHTTKYIATYLIRELDNYTKYYNTVLVLRNAQDKYTIDSWLESIGRCGIDYKFGASTAYSSPVMFNSLLAGLVCSVHGSEVVNELDVIRFTGKSSLYDHLAIELSKTNLTYSNVQVNGHVTTPNMAPFMAQFTYDAFFDDVPNYVLNAIRTYGPYHTITDRNETIYVNIDTERFGPHADDTFSIGVYATHENGQKFNMMDTNVLTWLHKKQQIDPVTEVEFLNQPSVAQVYTTLLQNCLTFDEAFSILVDGLLTLTKRYNVVVVSDIAVDYSLMMQNIASYLVHGCQQMYNSDVFDELFMKMHHIALDDFNRGLIKKSFSRGMWISDQTDIIDPLALNVQKNEPAHDPCVDAMNVSKLHISILNALKRT